MNKNQIEDLINSNVVIKKAYEKFRKIYPYNKVKDMWSHISFSERYPSEAYIKYVLSNGKIEIFEYVEEI